MLEDHTPDDTHHIQRFLRGDQRAAQAIHDAYRRDVERVLPPALRGHVDAQDFVQEVFARVFRGLPRFQGTSLRPWIRAIARNERARLLRRLSLQAHRRTEQPPPSAAPLSPDAEVEARRWLAGLPEASRRLAELHLLGGYTHEEIAAALSIPVGTVKSRLYRLLPRTFVVGLILGLWARSARARRLAWASAAVASAAFLAPLSEQPKGWVLSSAQAEQARPPSPGFVRVPSAPPDAVTLPSPVMSQAARALGAGAGRGGSRVVHAAPAATGQPVLLASAALPPAPAGTAARGAGVADAGSAHAPVPTRGTFRYQGRSFSVRHLDALLDPKGPSSGVRGYGGRVTGVVCGSSVNVEVEHHGGELLLVGYGGPFQLRVRDARGARRFSGLASQGTVELALGSSALVGQVGGRRFDLRQQGDALIGSIGYVNTPVPGEARVEGRDALWSLPAAVQAAILPTLLSCFTARIGQLGRSPLLVGVSGTPDEIFHGPPSGLDP